MLAQINRSDYWKIYYATHLEERRRQQREYYRRNRQARIVASQEYYFANKQDRLEYHRKYDQEHKETRLIQHKEWLKNNPAKRVQYTQNYRDSHKDAYKEYQRTYQHSAKRQLYRNNPEYQAKQRIITNRYRARQIELEATLTFEQWEAIIRAYRGRCAYCGRKMKKLTQDHVIPVSLGGSYIASNIIPSCLICNSSKGSKPPVKIPPIRLLI